MKKIALVILLLGSFSIYAKDKIGCDLEYVTNGTSGATQFAIGASESSITSSGGRVSVKRTFLGLGKVEVYAQDINGYSQLGKKYLKAKFKVKDLLSGEVGRVSDGNLFIEVKNCTKL